MKKQALWDLYLSKNAALRNAESIKFTPDMLRKFFDTTWEAGRKHGDTHTAINKAWDIEKEIEKLTKMAEKGRL